LVETEAVMEQMETVRVAVEAVMELM